VQLFKLLRLILLLRPLFLSPLDLRTVELLPRVKFPLDEKDRLRLAG
jgi:hypothetical protein